MQKEYNTFKNSLKAQFAKTLHSLTDLDELEYRKEADALEGKMQDHRLQFRAFHAVLQDVGAVPPDDDPRPYYFKKTELREVLPTSVQIYDVEHNREDNASARFERCAQSAGFKLATDSNKHTTYSRYRAVADAQGKSLYLYRYHLPLALPGQRAQTDDADRLKKLRRAVQSILPSEATKASMLDRLVKKDLVVPIKRIFACMEQNADDKRTPPRSSIFIVHERILDKCQRLSVLLSKNVTQMLMQEVKQKMGAFASTLKKSGYHACTAFSFARDISENDFMVQVNGNGRLKHLFYLPLENIIKPDHSMLEEKMQSSIDGIIKTFSHKIKSQNTALAVMRIIESLKKTGERPKSARKNNVRRQSRRRERRK